MSIEIATLIDIREAIERATTFVAGTSFNQFKGNEQLMWAVYSQIIVIGEAANRLSREFQQEHGDVP